MLFLKKKITYILKNSIYERELESFHFEKKKITSSLWKNENHLLEEKRGRLWKCYGKIIPKELMFQRFTSVSDGYTCFYVIMYSISMDSAYKPFYCKAATDFFFSSFSRCQCFMTARSLVLSESIFVYLRYWNKIPTAERRNSGL